MHRARAYSSVPGRAHGRMTRLAMAAVAGLALVLTATAHAAGTGEGVGRVIFRIGEVRLITDGAAQSVQRGDRVYEGDRLETGADGHVQIRFADGGFVALRPASAAWIRVYRSDAAAADDIRIKLELKRGTLRTVTGAGGERNRSGYRLNTPVAAIGIRGTDYTVNTSTGRTRVEVHGGGVTVAPLGADCLRGGFGACGGEGARSLTAREAAGRLIEVNRSDRAARIIEGNGDAGAANGAADDAANSAADDAANSAADDAANSAADAASSDSAAAATEALDERRATRDTLDEVPPADHPQDQPVAAPQPGDFPDRFADLRDDITWGRWSRYADGDAGAQRRDDQRIAAANRVFGLFVPEWSRWPDSGLPDAGTVSFVPGDAEAVVLDGDSVQAAAVRNPELTIDFNARSFRTAFDVSAPSMDADAAFHAQGPVGRNGGFRADAGASNTGVSGVVAPGAEQAGMLFQGDLPDGRTAAGAIDWFR